MRYTIIIIFCFTLLACVNNKIDYKTLESYQDHDIPDLKKEVENISKVLVVLPHADDEIAAAGLILYLKEKDAIVHLLTLCDHGEPRRGELKCSVEKIGFQKHENAGFINNKWEDIIENNIVFWRENKQEIKSVIQQKIYDFGPDALITYDSEIGATGHPEHLISAQITKDLFNENSNQNKLNPKYLFQITLPEKLENLIVAKTRLYKLTKQITKVEGMPGPNVALDIKKYWEIKNAAGFCHQSQLQILSKAYLVYDKDDKENHIKTFNKEYYKMLKQ